jgi:hypothetical protein
MQHNYYIICSDRIYKIHIKYILNTKIISYIIILRLMSYIYIYEVRLL